MTGDPAVTAEASRVLDAPAQEGDLSFILMLVHIRVNLLVSKPRRFHGFIRKVGEHRSLKCFREEDGSTPKKVVDKCQALLRR